MKFRLISSPRTPNWKKDDVPRSLFSVSTSFCIKYTDKIGSWLTSRIARCIQLPSAFGHFRKSESMMIHKASDLNIHTQAATSSRKYYEDLKFMETRFCRSMYWEIIPALISAWVLSNDGMRKSHSFMNTWISILPSARGSVAMPGVLWRILSVDVFAIPML